MIKEFWQERREEKKKEKELRKLEKKNKAKSSLWNKVCVVCFVLLIVVGPFAYNCNSSSNWDDYSWDNILGITDEMKESLSADVDKSKLITTREINSTDTARLETVMADVGLGGLISEEMSEEANIELTDDLTLDSYTLGALVNELLDIGSYSGNIRINELIVYESGEDMMLKSLMYINLSTITSSDNLPFVYITTTSKITKHSGTLVSLNEEITINNFDKELNDEILEVLDNSSMSDVDDYTNKLIVQQINFFATIIGAEVDVSTINLTFVKK